MEVLEWMMVGAAGPQVRRPHEPERPWAGSGG